jgi:hypothetical protein
MAKRLIIIGLVFVVLGLLWPVIRRLGLGHLPGDFTVERGSFRLYFPLATCLLLSLLLSALLWLIRHFR